MNNKGIMFTPLQRFYGALSNLDKFASANNLIDNVVCLDDFFSSFRSTSFVLQCALAHTEYEPLYDKFRQKYLKENRVCKWMVDTRNEVEKQHPFDLLKQVYVTIYTPVSAMILKSETFTVENDVEYQTLVESLKDELKKINTVEVHFSLDFRFRKADDNADLYNDICAAIIIMTNMLKDMYSTIGDCTELCDDLIIKIEELERKILKSEIIFVDDYVYYADKDIFEKGDRLIPELPCNNVDVRKMLESYGVKYPSYDSKGFMKFLAKLHLAIYQKQGRHLMPVIFVVYGNNICKTIPFDSSIRTTAYRKVNEIADKVISNDIKYVTMIHEAYNYKSFQYHMLPYYKRIEHSNGESIIVQQIGDGFVPRMMMFDTSKINDPKYVDDVLKNRFDVKCIVEKSAMYPIYLAIKEKRDRKATRKNS